MNGHLFKINRNLFKMILRDTDKNSIKMNGNLFKMSGNLFKNE